MKLNFSLVAEQICKHCKKSKLVHKATDLACPIGKKTRIGYITFSSDKKYEPKKI